MFERRPCFLVIPIDASRKSYEYITVSRTKAKLVYGNVVSKQLKINCLVSV